MEDYAWYYTYCNFYGDDSKDDNTYRYEMVQEFLERYCRKDSVMLDIGAGNGRFEVAEHLLCPEMGMRNVRRLLKTDGDFIVSVPDYSQITEDTSDIPNYFNLEHINYFSEISLDNLMHVNGMKRVAQKRVGIDLIHCYQCTNEEEPLQKDTITQSAVENYLWLSRGKKIMNSIVMVTVIITAYNHEKYLEQAIQGVLNQKTQYEFELYIHDDASTDGTQEIIRTYEKKYPEKVKSIIQEKNLFSQGKLGEVFYDYRLQGKYLAICDGDDYWISDTKLQKQISYMENHPECSMCIHNAIQHNSITGEEIVLNTFSKDGVYDQKQQILAGLGTNFPASASYVMRNDLIKDMPHFFVKPRAVDYPVRQYMACKGEVYYFHEPMSVYRIKSSHSYMEEAAKSRTFYNDYTVEMLAFFEAFNEYTDFKFNDIFSCKMDSDYYGFCSSIGVEAGILKASEYGFSIDKIMQCYKQLDIQNLDDSIKLLSENTNHLFIYGISKLALICKKQLEYAGIEYEGFVVSDGQIKVDNIEGKKVYTLSNALQSFEDTAFILAVQPVNLAAIESNLQAYHVTKYCKPFVL